MRLAARRCRSFVLMTATMVALLPRALPAADTAKSAATVEDAVKVLDLRTLELPRDAIPPELRQVGSLNYETKGDPKATFKFHQQQFAKLGWKELAGTMTEATYATGMFQKSGFVVSITTSDAGRPDKPGFSRVSLTNFGNVLPGSLPVVKGAKSQFASEATAMYLTDAKPADAVEATRKLLLDAGWEPYGSFGKLPDGVMQKFKRNAIQVSANVSVATAQEGKTSIMLAAILLSADIPAPTTAQDVNYVDMLKTLRFTSADSYADVARYYLQTMTRRGWKSTTEDLVTATDRFKRPTGMLVFRNPAKDMLTLDLTTQDDKTHAVVRHLTDAEFTAIEEKAKQEEQKRLAENEARKKKPAKTAEREPGGNDPAPAAKGTVVGIPVPQKAKKVNKTADNVLQISLAPGKGKGTAEMIRDHLVAAKWKLEEDAELDETSGNLTLKKNDQQVTLTYVDTGITDVMLMVIGIGTKLETTKPDPDATKK